MTACFVVRPYSPSAPCSQKPSSKSRIWIRDGFASAVAADGDERRVDRRHRNDVRRQRGGRRLGGRRRNRGGRGLGRGRREGGRGSLGGRGLGARWWTLRSSSRSAPPGRRRHRHRRRRSSRRWSRRRERTHADDGQSERDSSSTTSDVHCRKPYWWGSRGSRHLTKFTPIRHRPVSGRMPAGAGSEARLVDRGCVGTRLGSYRVRSSFDRCSLVWAGHSDRLADPPEHVPARHAGRLEFAHRHGPVSLGQAFPVDTHHEGDVHVGRRVEARAAAAAPTCRGVDDSRSSPRTTSSTACQPSSTTTARL